MSNSETGSVDVLARAFRALASPHRLTILQRLAACCPQGTVCGTADDMSRCVGELGTDLGIAPSTLSHHIRELRRAGLIRIRRDGRNLQCSVDYEGLRSLATFFEEAVGARPERRQSHDVRSPTRGPAR